MRTIERTSQFKRDYKRERKGRRGASLDASLSDVLNLLIRDTPLPEKYVDHPLGGDWKGFRDAHVFPDLILLYEKPDRSTLRLVRLGSHSELGL
jgi:mRNA interferase YafQ